MSACRFGVDQELEKVQVKVLPEFVAGHSGTLPT
jgi:hypothetical protein